MEPGVWLGRSLESKCLRRSGLRNSRMQVSSHVGKGQGGSDHARRTESVRGLAQRAWGPSSRSPQHRVEKGRLDTCIAHALTTVWNGADTTGLKVSWGDGC